jgi:hypothetical protein
MDDTNRRDPASLDDDQLEARLRKDQEEMRPGHPLEQVAPVSLEDDPSVDLDIDGVRERS